MDALSTAEYRKLALWLRGYSFSEIAKVEDLPANTTARHVRKAMHKMALLMGYSGQYEEVWARDNAKAILEVANKLRLRTAFRDEANKRSFKAMKKRVEKRRGGV
jgi:hypothetical protein